jgi:hypothetical protein
MIDLNADTKERALLEKLDAAIRRPPVRKLLDDIAGRLEARLTRNPGALMEWEVVPLTAYGGELPSAVRSSWVFILRAGAATGAERHPNSQQRMMSYRGAGDFPVWRDGAWRSNLLVSDEGVPLERRWVSIPPMVWHQSMKPAQDWVVVSFHTAREDELIEERGDPAAPSSVSARKYVNEEEGEEASP